MYYMLEGMYVNPRELHFFHITDNIWVKVALVLIRASDL
jgi:hypothetical protein